MNRPVYAPHPDHRLQIGISVEGTANDYRFTPSWGWAKSGDFPTIYQNHAAATEAGRKAWIAAGRPYPPA